jgi:hypothetical protein
MKRLDVFIAAAMFITVIIIFGDPKQWVGNLVSFVAFLITLLLLRKYRSRK